MKKTLALGMAAALLAIGGWAMGCSSSTDNGGGATDDGGTTADGSTKKDGGTAVGLDSGTGGGGGDAGTGGETGGGTGVCATQCAQSFCANPPKDPQAGDPCDTCLNNALAQGQQCNTEAVNACKADPDCIALETKCLPGCPKDGGGAPGDAPDGSTDTQCATYNRTACDNCCAGNHQKGVDTLNTAIINCACLGQ